MGMLCHVKMVVLYKCTELQCCVEKDGQWTHNNSAGFYSDMFCVHKNTENKGPKSQKGPYTDPGP